MNSFSPTDSLIGIGLTAAMLQRLVARPAYDGESPMRVTELRRDVVCLHDGQREVRAVLPPTLTQALADDALAVGDWVLAIQPAPGRWRVIERVPPLTQIARRTNDGRGAAKRQVLVANVDTAFLVMGLDHDFNLRRLERYLAVAHLAAVPAVLVLTKADTLAAPLLQRRLDDARDVLGSRTPLVAVDARAPQSAARLEPWLARGQTTVMLGSSGAGKSTLTNSLCGDALQDTGAVRADDGRGRHTTTVRTLRFALAGGCVIDTPGLRALRLDVDDAADLTGVFDDVGALALHCRFRNCRHQSEPGCAVREGLPAERVRNFHKLQREVRRDAMNALEMREQRRDWKLRGREGAMRARAKRSG
ncbi:MAG TPA: ribosome small subunit-dependent GTPase A [Burkholderiaceae bacterium]|nr:ribosome small subunit-dependent GTPase A [Burkholderiaceae bacterium]